MCIRDRYKDRIAVGIDAKEGCVAIKGWAENSNIDPVSLAKDMHKMGVANIIYTDISKDGMMEGPNLDKTEMIVKETWMNLIASGGISRDVYKRQNRRNVSALRWTLKIMSK